MRVIRHRLSVLVTLLTAINMAAASLAQARNDWQYPVVFSNTDNTPPVCIDRLYRVTRCLSTTRPLSDNRTLWQNPVYNNTPSTNHIIFALTKARCRPRYHRHRSLLRALFPSLPDLQLELERFAVNVEVPSALENISQSTIHLGYRNCW